MKRSSWRRSSLLALALLMTLAISFVTYTPLRAGRFGTHLGWLTVGFLAQTILLAPFLFVATLAIARSAQRPVPAWRELALVLLPVALGIGSSEVWCAREEAAFRREVEEMGSPRLHSRERAWPAIATWMHYTSDRGFSTEHDPWLR